MREEERPEAEQEGQGVDAERRGGADERDDQPAHGRTGDPGDAPGQQPGRVARPEDLRRHEVGDDRRVRGREERLGRAERHRGDVEVLDAQRS